MKFLSAPYQHQRMAFPKVSSSVSLALLFLLLLALPLRAYDYSLRVIGPRTATQGYPLYLRIQAAVTEGERMWVNYKVDAFDFALDGPGANPAWGNSTWGPSAVNLKLEIPSGFPPGSYVVTITAESGGVIHSVKAPVEVVAPTPIKRKGQGRQSNANIAEWTSQMVEYGQKHCDPRVVAKLGSWEGNIWYYDGDRVYQQIAKYLRDDKWLACAGYSRAVYRDYVLKAVGKVPGYRVFPHGLSMEGSSDSRRALEELSENSSYAYASGGIDVALSRETAYLLSTFILTGDSHQRLAASFALGHLDQWVHGKPYQPFMAGLTMAALIEAYERTGDVRIPAAVQKMLDKMWEEAWSSRAAAFTYWSNSSSPVPDLNLLIAPAYAWFYKISGDAVYLERGDQIFNGGVAGAWLDGGKQFSQNYRWSFDYLKWSGLDGSEYNPPPSEPEVVTRTPPAKPARPVPVTPEQPVCEPRLPTLAISLPKILPVRTGRDNVTMAEYQVTVTNNDAVACGAASFSLTFSVANPASMKLNVSDVRLKLEPGKSSTTRVVGMLRQRTNGKPEIAATLSGSSLGAVSASR